MTGLRTAIPVYCLTGVNIAILYGVFTAYTIRSDGAIEGSGAVSESNYLFHLGLVALGVSYFVQKSLNDYLVVRRHDSRGATLRMMTVTLFIFSLGLIGIWFVDLARALDLTDWATHRGNVTDTLVSLSIRDVYWMGLVFQVLSTVMQSLMGHRLMGERAQDR